MQVTIFGATGSVGKHLVNEALKFGNQVTAVVRDPSKLAVEHDNLRIVVADVMNDVADFMIRQLRSLDYLRKTPALSY